MVMPKDVRLDVTARTVALTHSASTVEFVDEVPQHVVFTVVFVAPRAPFGPLGDDLGSYLSIPGPVPVRVIDFEITITTTAGKHTGLYRLAAWPRASLPASSSTWPARSADTFWPHCCPHGDCGSAPASSNALSPSTRHVALAPTAPATKPPPASKSSRPQTLDNETQPQT
nr:hypothetical protein [Streptomyces oryzae]